MKYSTLPKRALQPERKEGGGVRADSSREGEQVESAGRNSPRPRRELRAGRSENRGCPRAFPPSLDDSRRSSSRYVVRFISSMVAEV